MSSYTPTGPFSNGTSPGLSAALFNNIEAWIAQVDNTPVTTLTGSSGNAKLYMPLQGNYKVAMIVLNGYQNTSGSVQTLALPTSFVTSVYVRTKNIFQIELRVGSTAQNIDIITALATVGGTISTQTNIAAHSFGSCNAAVDHIGFRSGGSGPQTSIIFLEGF
jgi:hypothetical protein